MSKRDFLNKAMCVGAVTIFSILPMAINAKPTTIEPAHLNRATYDIKGWAKDTLGGKGGRIIRVTNLNADGPGSLKAAIDATGPRIVVFEIGGVIDLNGATLSIKNPYLTIAGQTAPGKGITIIRGETNARDTHDIIIQHMMFRSGDAGKPRKSGFEADSFSTVGSYNIIVDHCSFSWGTDENLSASGKRFKGKDINEWRLNTSHNITYSNNLVYEGLRNSTHAKGEHSKGGLFHDNTTGILLYGNLYASNMERNGLFKGGSHAAEVNNVIYNPGLKAIHYNLIAHEWEGVPYQNGILTLIGNVYRQGPDTVKGLPLFMIGGAGDINLYMKDNIALDANGNPVPQTGRYTSSSAKIINATIPYLPPDIKILPANKLENEIPFSVGARPWARDVIDFKILSDVAEGRGEIIDTQEQNYIGYPKYEPVTKPFNEADWNLDDMSPKIGWKAFFTVHAAEH